MDNLGEYIRRQREAKRMSIEELSQITKISVAVLRDIENGKFDRYKGDEAYVKMYLKKISSVLSLDSGDVTQQYLDLTQEIEFAKLHEHDNEVHEESITKAKAKSFSFKAPQLARKPSVYEDKSHMTIVRTAIILVLVCLVIVVVWYGFYSTRSQTDEPSFVPNETPTVEGDVGTGDNQTPDNTQPTNPSDTNANITFTRNGVLDFNMVLPEGVEKITLKMEFAAKTWAKLSVDNKVYDGFKSKIYHDYDEDKVETVELELSVSEFKSLKLRTGYSVGHRYYINGQQIPLTGEDSFERPSDLKINLVKE
ncbi:MAG: helix-turn-helix domain-containing protein [Coprobacillus sp.]